MLWTAGIFICVMAEKRLKSTLLVIHGVFANEEMHWEDNTAEEDNRIFMYELEKRPLTR